MIQLPEIKRQTKNNARRLRLRIRADGIFLTLPPKVSELTIQQFLQASQDWMQEHWQKLQLAVPNEPTNTHITDSEQVAFPMLAKQWRVKIITEPSKKVVVHEDCLLLPQQHAEKLLKQWVLEQAKIYLPLRLSELAKQHQFNYQQCKVRHAKSRWGSCSSLGVINLNAALILMPVELMEYVLLHELCHTRQMNHSDKFWAEMYAVDSECKSNRQAVQQFKLPRWWYHA